MSAFMAYIPKYGIIKILINQAYDPANRLLFHPGLSGNYVHGHSDFVKLHVYSPSRVYDYARETNPFA